MPGKDGLGISLEGNEALKGFFVAAEQTLALQGFEIEFVEERAIAIGRSACAGKINRIAILAYHPTAVGQLAVHGCAGVGVFFIGGEVPHKARFFRRVNVEEESLAPVAVIVVFIEDGDIRVV